MQERTFLINEVQKTFLENENRKAVSHEHTRTA